MSNPYRVPKRHIVTEVLLTTGPPLQLRFFLSESAKTHDGPELPSDFLKRAKKFLPAYDPAGESLTILRRTAIVVFTVSEREEFPDAEAQAILEPARTQGGMVEVELDTGATVRGELRYEMPEGQRRVQDFMNTDESFVMLRNPEKISFINKTHIVRIRMLG